MTLSKIRIGTRKSALAMVQANMVRDLLTAAWPGLSVDLVPLITSGDAFSDQPLSNIGGKGLFTKEIEEALLEGRVDIAVHSTKDMSTVLPPGLIIACALEREDPRDMLVGQGLDSLADIPEGASFGTSSLRRSAQLLMQRPDIKIVPLRGNVQTRLAKLEKGEMRATMLAVAGLKRLGLQPSGVILETDNFLPAIAQGVIGIECRSDNHNVRDMLVPLAHAETEMAVTCERAFLRALDGSCRTPIAGYAKINGGSIHFRGLIVKPDGSKHHRIEIEADAKTPQALRSQVESLGLELGKELLQKAGKDFLR